MPSSNEGLQTGTVDDLEVHRPDRDIVRAHDMAMPGTGRVRSRRAIDPDMRTANDITTDLASEGRDPPSAPRSSGGGGSAFSTFRLTKISPFSSRLATSVPT